LRSSVYTMSAIVHRCCAGLYPCLPPLNNGQDKRDVFKAGLSMSTSPRRNYRQRNKSLITEQEELLSHEPCWSREWRIRGEVAVVERVHADSSSNMLRQCDSQ
jgi:hypothetical protein